MGETYGASDVEYCAGEALGLGLRADRDAAWAPLVLAMAEMERLVFHRVGIGHAEWFFFRRMTSRFPTLEFWGLRNL